MENSPTKIPTINLHLHRKVALFNLQRKFNSNNFFPSPIESFWHEKSFQEGQKESDFSIEFIHLETAEMISNYRKLPQVVVPQIKPNTVQVKSIFNRIGKSTFVISKSWFV